MMIGKFFIWDTVSTSHVFAVLKGRRSNIFGVITKVFPEEHVTTIE